MRFFPTITLGAQVTSTNTSSNGETAFPVATGVAAVIDLYPNNTACTCAGGSMSCPCVGGTGLYIVNTTASGSSLGVNVLNHGGGGTGSGGGTTSGPFSYSSPGYQCPPSSGCSTAYDSGPYNLGGTVTFDYYGGVLVWSYQSYGWAAPEVWTHAVIPSGSMPASFFFTAFAKTAGTQYHTSYVNGPIQVSCSPPTAPITYRRGPESPADLSKHPQPITLPPCCSAGAALAPTVVS